MPSSIDSESEFSVGSDSKSCWEFFSDLPKLGMCIPGCESVTPLDDGSAVFKVKVSVGYISRTFELRARFKDVEQNSKVTFVAEGRDAEITGTLSIGEGGRQGETKVSYRLQIRPLSTIGRTAMAMVGKDLVRKQTDAFATCSKARLEKSAG